MKADLPETGQISFPDSPPALERTPLKDQVTNLVRNYIVKGKLPSGSKLIERELAEWLGVSRMPVHDALVQLEKEGLVVSRSDARYIISLTRGDLIELFQVRGKLERLAGELAAKNNSPEAALQYRKALGTMQAAVDRHDTDAFIDAHMAIHRAIWQGAHNLHLSRALDSILGPIQIFMSRPEYIQWDFTVERHSAIIAAILAGDPGPAGDLMELHIVKSLEQTLQTLVDA